jgi:lipopolysaccharide biosynthesis glycosyltransferase
MQTTKFKYLYVLISDASDLYYEQALLSVVSLRNRMPDAFISLLTDDISAETLKNKRSYIHNLINELKAVSISQTLSKIGRSRWLKTSMRQHIEGDFLYIDCDTIIADDLSNIEKLEITLGAVLNSHCLFEDDFYRKEAMELNKKLDFSNPETNKFFNGGMLFCRDTQQTHEFFSEWHRLWRYSISKKVTLDQPSLNQANRNFGHVITELDGMWNCQIAYGGVSYLTNAKIIHYFGIGKEQKPYILGNRDILQSIQKNGIVSDDILDKLQNAKTLFHNTARLLSDRNILAVIDSTLFRFLVKISGKKLFGFINALFVIISRIRLAIKHHKT